MAQKKQSIQQVKNENPKEPPFQLGQDVEPRFTREQFAAVLWKVGKPKA